MADPQPIQVTNNTSALIELFDAYQASTGDAGPTAATPVTYTSLGTVKPGATGTIKTLHASNHIVAMQSGPLSDPAGGTQADFPVKIIAVLTITKAGRSRSRRPTRTRWSRRSASSVTRPPTRARRWPPSSSPR